MGVVVGDVLGVVDGVEGFGVGVGVGVDGADVGVAYATCLVYVASQP